MLTIEALDYDQTSEDDEIDVIVKSIPFLVNNDEVNVEEIGTNGIGWFNFSYHLQNSDSNNSYECSINSVTTTVTSPLPTSCTYTYNESVPVHSSTDQPLGESSVTTSVTDPLSTSCTCNETVPVHSSTDQPLEESSVTTSVTDPLPTSSTCSTNILADNSTNQPLTTSSSLWALIPVAIMLLLTLLVTIIIAICIVRNMSMKKKETKKRSSGDCDGEHTCIHLLVVNSNSLTYKGFEPSYSTKYVHFC